MASSPVTAPSPVSQSPPTPPTPPSVPPTSSSSPPPPVSSPPPPNASPPPSLPPPTTNPSPPPTSTGSSPPPPSNNTPPSQGPILSSSRSPPPPPPPPPPSSHSEELSPPPPRHSTRTHSPPPPRSKSTHSSLNSNASDPNLPMIIGITAGVVGVIFILMIIICVCCCKKKKKPHDGMHYHGENSRQGSRPPKGGDNYYNNPQPPTWHNSPQPLDHVVKLPPPPGAMMPPPGGAWPPPPPQPMMSSGDMSSNFSGGFRQPPLPPPSPNIALGFNKSTFTYDELAIATNGFSQANMLGQGGFGYVHKGVMPNGKEVAVKSLKAGSGQGEREFQAEVEIISRVHHRHLVSLVGYCIAGGQRMLVYEFVPNGTLEYHLHGKGRPTMDWPTRLKIAMGSAKGLAYLHEDCHPRIIHRDIKTANILLDYKFEAMVADFGLAKLSPDTNTHVSTRIMGTFGYLAPEYASSGKLTEKSDVFSYGVMLLELITGRRPVDPSCMEDSLVDWARPILENALENGNGEELVDPRLENNYDTKEMGRLMACAAACVRHSGRRRPKMSQIVRALEGDVLLEDLNEGMKRGQSRSYSSGGSVDYDSGSYTTNMQKLRRAQGSNNNYGSSEYSGPTSEYGVNPSSSSSDSEYSREMRQPGNQRRFL